MRAILFSCLLLLSSTGLWAQEKEIEIRQAGSFQLDEENFPGANILERSATKQVHLVHQGMDVWSDKAFFYCLLYTSPSPRDVEESRMPSSA